MKKPTLKLPLSRILILFCIIFFIAITVMVLTTPLHELTHVFLSSFDPHLKVTDVYFFGGPSHTADGHALPSVLGCVMVQEAYPGAFRDRPQWADLEQEVICLAIQILLTCIIILKILKAMPFLTKYPQHTVSSLPMK